MDKHQFNEFITKLVVYFGKEKFYLGTSGKDRQALWYEKLNHIPAEALSWIRDQIQMDFDMLPTNIPKSVNHYWLEWLSKHPEKRARENKSYENCPHCHFGILAFLHRPDGYPAPTEKVARCGYCRSDNREALGPYWTERDIKSIGGVLLRPGNEETSGIKYKELIENFK